MSLLMDSSDVKDTVSRTYDPPIILSDVSLYMTPPMWNYYVINIYSNLMSSLTLTVTPKLLWSGIKHG